MMRLLAASLTRMLALLPGVAVSGILTGICLRIVSPR